MLPERIGSSQLAEMAARELGQSARLRPASLERLAPLLATAGGVTGEELQVRVSFRQGAEGLPEMGLQVSGVLGLVCQRCLGRVDWPCDLDVSLTIVSSDAEAAQLSSPYDSVVLKEGELELLRTLEDELLAALPLAPVHGGSERCRTPATRGTAERASPAPANRPFADLAQLLGRNPKATDE
jgi:uncharacterized protein